MVKSTFNDAKKAKADEFYTQLPDIETELRHYRDQLRGKVILCNCDDPYESNFFKYFAMNFNFLGLKKLIATCYAGSVVAGEQLSLFDVPALEPRPDSPRHAYKIEITEVPDENGDGATDLADVELLLRNGKNVLTLLQGDGDFRSRECVELLKLSDVVVTNPPFSLFREYLAQLMEHDKGFLILGSQGAISYADVFGFIQRNRLWLGYDNGGEKWFRVPMDYQNNTPSRLKIVDGIKYLSMGSVYWFTNLDTTRRHEPLTLYRRYSPDEYPTYANYDAIEVSKVADIPLDFDGDMGVPITFLDKYNPDQFELIGQSRQLSRPIIVGDTVIERFQDRNGYMRQAARERFCLPDGDAYKRVFDRIVIRNKHPEARL